MKHLVRSFQQHVGARGCHFYDDEHCTFLSWREVFHFIDNLPENRNKDSFSEKLADSLSNYNPDSEFLAVHQAGESVSVELYTQSVHGSSRY